MEAQFTDADISEFLTQLIELGDVDVVDRSPDKYIKRREGDTLIPETITTEGKRVPLAVYGTKAADAIIINPFAEGTPDSTKSIWFYASRNTILSSRILKILIYLIEVGANSKKKNGEDIKDLMAAKYLAKYVQEIDDTTIKEIKTLASGTVQDFFIIYYNKSKRLGEVRCVVFSKEQRKAYNLRVKTWKVLEGLVLEILGVTSLSDFDYRTDSLSIPVFQSFAHIYVNVFSHLKEPLMMVGEKVEHLTSLESHLKYLDQYRLKASWCVSPSQGTNQMPVPSPAPWGISPTGVPVPQAAIPMPYQVNMVPQPGFMPGMCTTYMPALPYGANGAIPLPGMGIPVAAPGIPQPPVVQTPDNQSYARATGNPCVVK